MRGTAAVSLAFVLLLPHSAVAQRALPPIGTRIRTTPRAHDDPYIMGKLVAQSGDTLVIEVPAEDTARVPLASLSRLEVSDGMHGHWGRGAGYGLLVGAAGGAGIGAAAIDSEWRAVGALLGAGTGALLGFLIGGGIGQSVERERWKPAPGWELSFSAQPTARGVGIAIRF